MLNADLSSPLHGVSSRDYLALIKRSFAIGTWAYDVILDRFEWSEGLRRLLRVSAQTGNSLNDFLNLAHPDDRQALDDKIRTGLNLENTPIRMRTPGRTMLWLQFHMDTIHDDHGQRVVFGAAQDITEVKTAHAAFLQRRRLAMSLVSLLDAIVWYVSPSGALDFEVGWCNFTGSTPAENHGEGWLKFIHPEDRTYSKAAWRQSLQTRAPFLVTHRVRRSDGTHHLFQATGAPMLNDAGEIVEIIGFARKIVEGEQIQSPAALARQTGFTAPDLRGARAILGWSTERLAAESGVSRSTIRRLEAGEREKPTVGKASMERLASTLVAAGVSFSWERDGAVRVIRRNV
jgi:PAS domain S-box-containing protein